MKRQTFQPIRHGCNIRPRLIVQVSVDQVIHCRHAAPCKQTFRQFRGGHLKRYEKRLVSASGRALCKVKQKSGFADAGTRADDDELTRLEALDDAVQPREARVDTRLLFCRKAL